MFLYVYMLYLYHIDIGLYLKTINVYFIFTNNAFTTVEHMVGTFFPSMIFIRQGFTAFLEFVFTVKQ